LKPLQFTACRGITIVQALKTLYCLPSSSVDSFLQSYTLFDQDSVTAETESKIIDYYCVLNWLCSLGEVEKMYFPPILDGSAGTIGNQTLFEKKMAKELGITAMSRVLDIGCGRGRIAAHIATETGAHVTGINIDPNQLESACSHARRNNLETNLTFKQSSLNNPLPFENDKLDAIYEVQAFTYCTDKEQVFSELFRVLRPGGKVSFLDWFVLKNYDQNNLQHREIMAQVKPLLGAVWTPTVNEFCSLLEKAGFKILTSHNPSIDGVQWPLVKPVDDYFQLTKWLIHILVKLRVFPKHFDVLFTRLTKGADKFMEGDKKKLFTTCYQIIAQKPMTTNTSALCQNVQCYD